jgi:hypothetical protein
MWAVLIGEPELAKLLWTKTKEPMRMAILASRAMAQLQDELGDVLEADQIEEQKNMYEDWAVGVLQTCKDARMAGRLLTLVPKRKHPEQEAGPEFILLWNDSVMDQACNPEHMCRKFVSQKNCQELLDNYFRGNHCTSYFKIEVSASIFRIYLQMIKYFCVFLTFGLAAQCLPDFLLVSKV